MSGASPPRRLPDPADRATEPVREVSVDDVAALVPDIPLPVWVYDLATLRIEAANACALRTYGYPRAEFVGLTADRLRPEEDGAAFREHVRTAGASGPARFRSRHRTASGHVLQVEVSAETIVTPARSLRRVFVLDVSTRTSHDEDRLRLTRAVEQSEEAIIITDADGSILYVNPAFERVTGYSRAEALGANPRLLKSGRQDPAVYADMWATLGAGQVWRGRLVNRRKDGTLFEEEATISPVRDDDGVVRSYVAVKRDVTRERQLEEQVRRGAKMEAIGRLAGGVAHDFNNLLNVITGYAELGLRRLPPESDVRRHVAEILRAADRAASLTRQLLAVSRRQVLQPRVIDLNDVLRDMDRLLRRLIGEDVRMETRLAREPLRVMADPGQLEQVLMNLAVNARDAMPGGGILVFETAGLPLAAPAAGDVSAGPCVALSVTDTGCGMDAETLSHVFEPFFTTKPEGKGTGLGLSTVWGIVKQSGGTVTIQSQPGAGTTFRVLLPRLGVDTPEPESPRPPGDDVPSAPTVLVVDDEAPLRSVIRDVLELAGYRVLEAEDGATALALAGQEDARVDLLVTDVTMPVMDGTALVREFRARHPGTRVVVMSGLAEHAQAAEKGDAFLSKPFTTATLEQAVREALAASAG